MNVFKKSALVLILPLALFLFSAQTTNAITVSPVIIEHEVAPGMKVSGKLTITNDASQEETYYTSIQSFVPDGEEGGQKYLEEGMDSGLPSWFKLSSNAEKLKPSESAEVGYELLIPADAEPGGHYATVFFSTTPNNPENRTGVGLTAKTGIIFLINVMGDIKEEANIESFTVNHKIISALPAAMSLRIRNTGSVHFRPKGTLTVRNMWGGIVARVPANPKNSAVLPNSIRRLDTWWAKSLDIPKTTSFKDGLINEWKNFALGRYVATVDVKYGTKNLPLEPKTVSFWVFPWRMGLILLGLLALLFVGMKIYNKALIKAALGKKESKK